MSSTKRVVNVAARVVTAAVLVLAPTMALTEVEHLTFQPQTSYADSWWVLQGPWAAAHGWSADEMIIDAVGSMATMVAGIALASAADSKLKKFQMRKQSPTMTTLPGRKRTEVDLSKVAWIEPAAFGASLLNLTNGDELRVVGTPEQIGAKADFAPAIRDRDETKVWVNLDAVAQTEDFTYGGHTGKGGTELTFDGRDGRVLYLIVRGTSAELAKSQKRAVRAL